MPRASRVRQEMELDPRQGTGFTRTTASETIAERKGEEA
jgi:hypothetical protein